jgi:predicted phage-related endonuclease
MNLKVDRPQPAFRMFTLTGHDARLIMGQDEEALRRLWRRKRGEAAPELEEVQAAELARASVAANLAQFQRNTGRKLVEGESRLRHPRLRWMGAILDGRLEDGAVLEAKYGPSTLVSANDAREMFYATAQHDLWVAQAKVAALSIVTADGRWFEAAVEADSLYQHLLLTAERRFLRCLETGEPPGLFLLQDPAPETLPQAGVDMSASKEWAEAARLFRETARAHEAHQRARDRLAQLLPPDAIQGAAAGVAVERAPLGGVRVLIVSAGGAHA